MHHIEFYYNLDGRKILVLNGVLEIEVYFCLDRAVLSVASATWISTTATCGASQMYMI